METAATTVLNLDLTVFLSSVSHVGTDRYTHICSADAIALQRVSDYVDRCVIDRPQFLGRSAPPARGWINGPAASECSDNSWKNDKPKSPYKVGRSGPNNCP
jgi:hypothetical protein